VCLCAHARVHTQPQGRQPCMYLAVKVAGACTLVQNTGHLHVTCSYPAIVLTSYGRECFLLPACFSFVAVCHLQSVSICSACAAQSCKALRLTLRFKDLQGNHLLHSLQHDCSALSVHHALRMLCTLCACALSFRCVCASAADAAHPVCMRPVLPSVLGLVSSTP